MTGTTLEQLQVVIEAETKQFRDELAKVQTQVNAATSQVERQTSKIKSAFGSIGKVIAGLGVGYGLYNLGKQAISYASDIQEVQNVVDTAFGSMSYKCEEFAKNSIKQFGMSELSAKKTASTYMAMAKGIGMGSDSASDMAISLAGLTGDVASFFNISQNEAGTKLKSVFTGETESLKDIGVVMTQTNLKQYALKQGLSDNIEAMDQATLTTLRYKFVMDQLGLAQGDFAKTSGSWANQVRILQEQWKQLMGIVGSGLVAVFTPIIQAINAAIGKIIQFAQVVQAVFSSLFGKKGNGPGDETKKIGTGLGMAEDSAGGLNNQLDKTGEKAKKAAKQMNNLFSFDQINKLKDDSSSSDDSSGGVSIAGINSSGLGLDEEIDTSGIDKTVSKIKKQMEGFQSFLSDNEVAIKTILGAMTAGFVTFFGLKWFSKIGGLTGLLVGFLDLPGMQGLAKSTSKIFSSILSVFNSGFGKITKVVGSGIKAISSAFMKIPGMEFLVGKLSAGFMAVKTMFGSLFSKIGTIISVGVGKLSSLFTSLITAIMNIPIIGPIIEKVFAGITAVFTKVSTAISSLLGTIAASPALIAGVVAAIVGAFTQLWLTNDEWKEKVLVAWDNIAAMLQSVWNNVIQPIFMGIAALAITVWQGGLKPLWEAWVELVRVISSAIMDLWNFLSPYIMKALEYLGPIFTTAFQVLGVLIGTVLNTVMGIVSTMFTVIANAVDWVVSSVSNAKADFEKIIGAIGDIFSGLTDFIAGIFTLDFDRAIAGLIRIFEGLWNGLVGIVSGVWNTILGLFANGGRIFSGVVDGIANVFRQIVNALISGINNVISWPFDRINGFLNDIRDFSILGQRPFAGMWGYNPIWVPQIPMLAQGAVVDKATMAMVGEAGREAIVPLDRNTRGLDLLASRLIERIYPQAPVQSQGGGNLYITLMLENGKVLTNYIIEEYNKLMVSQNGVGGFVQ